MAKLHSSNSTLLAKFRYVSNVETKRSTVYAAVKAIGKKRTIQVLAGNGTYKRSAKLEARWDSAVSDCQLIWIAEDRIVSPLPGFIELMTKAGWEYLPDAL